MSDTPEAKRKERVAHVIGWTTALVCALVLLWLSHLLPYGGTAAWLTVGGAGIGTWLLLSRIWTTWHAYPTRLSRVVFGVAGGLLIAVAYGELLRTSHAECVTGTTGFNPECLVFAAASGPAYGNAVIALLVAGVLIWLGAQGDDS